MFKASAPFPGTTASMPSCGPSLYHPNPYRVPSNLPPQAESQIDRSTQLATRAWRSVRRSASVVRTSLGAYLLSRGMGVMLDWPVTTALRALEHALASTPDKLAGIRATRAVWESNMGSTHGMTAREWPKHRALFRVRDDWLAITFELVATNSSAAFDEMFVHDLQPRSTWDMLFGDAYALYPQSDDAPVSMQSHLFHVVSERDALIDPIEKDHVLNLEVEGDPAVKQFELVMTTARRNIMSTSQEFLSQLSFFAPLLQSDVVSFEKARSVAYDVEGLQIALDESAVKIPAYVAFLRGRTLSRPRNVFPDAKSLVGKLHDVRDLTPNVHAAAVVFFNGAQVKNGIQQGSVAYNLNKLSQAIDNMIDAIEEWDVARQQIEFKWEETQRSIADVIATNAHLEQRRNEQIAKDRAFDGALVNAMMRHFSRSSTLDISRKNFSSCVVWNGAVVVSFSTTNLPQQFKPEQVVATATSDDEATLLKQAVDLMIGSTPGFATKSLHEQIKFLRDTMYNMLNVDMASFGSSYARVEDSTFMAPTYDVVWNASSQNPSIVKRYAHDEKSSASVVRGGFADAASAGRWLGTPNAATKAARDVSADVRAAAYAALREAPPRKETLYDVALVRARGVWRVVVVESPSKEPATFVKGVSAEAAEEERETRAKRLLASDLNGVTGAREVMAALKLDTVVRDDAVGVSRVPPRHAITMSSALRPDEWVVTYRTMANDVAADVAQIAFDKTAVDFMIGAYAKDVDALNEVEFTAMIEVFRQEMLKARIATEGQSTTVTVDLPHITDTTSRGKRAAPAPTAAPPIESKAKRAAVRGMRDRNAPSAGWTVYMRDDGSVAPVTATTPTDAALTVFKSTHEATAIEVAAKLRATFKKPTSAKRAADLASADGGQLSAFATELRAAISGEGDQRTAVTEHFNSLTRA